MIGPTRQPLERAPRAVSQVVIRKLTQAVISRSRVAILLVLGVGLANPASSSTASPVGPPAAVFEWAAPSSPVSSRSVGLDRKGRKVKGAEKPKKPSAWNRFRSRVRGRFSRRNRASDSAPVPNAFEGAHSVRLSQRLSLRDNGALRTRADGSGMQGASAPHGQVPSPVGSVGGAAPGGRHGALRRRSQRQDAALDGRDVPSDQAERRPRRRSHRHEFDPAWLDDPNFVNNLREAKANASRPARTRRGEYQSVSELLNSTGADAGGNQGSVNYERLLPDQIYGPLPSNIVYSKLPDSRSAEPADQPSREGPWGRRVAGHARTAVDVLADAAKTRGEGAPMAVSPAKVLDVVWKANRSPAAEVRIPETTLARSKAPKRSAAARQPVAGVQAVGQFGVTSAVGRARLLPAGQYQGRLPAAPPGTSPAVGRARLLSAGQYQGRLPAAPPGTSPARPMKIEHYDR